MGTQGVCEKMTRWGVSDICDMKINGTTIKDEKGYA